MGFLSDVAHLLPRCPRCGYGLRLVRGYWWCDVCRAPPPQRGPTIRETFRHVGESLRRFLGMTPRRHATLARRVSVPSFPGRGVPLARCPNCGGLTPSGAVACVHCGTVFDRGARVPIPQVTRTSRVSQRDEIVYRYIVENGGEISLSKASTDLRLTVPELQASIRRLEDSRRIMPDDSGREQRTG